MKKTLLLSALGAIAFSCSQPTEAPAENHEGHDHNHESMAPEEVDEAPAAYSLLTLKTAIPLLIQFTLSLA